MLQQIKKLIAKFKLNPEQTLNPEAGQEGNDSVAKEQPSSLVQRVHFLKNTTVDDLMVPRVDIIAIPLSISKEELMSLLAKQKFNYFPVYNKNLDDVVGFVHAKNIARAVLKKDFILSDVVQEVLFIPEAMRAFDLFQQMRSSKIPIAVVVDEFGGVDGLITVEDLIDEIMHEEEEGENLHNSPHVVRLQDGSFILDARLSLKDFEERFGEVLTDEEREEDLDTVGGLITYLAGRVPGYKEIITHSSGIEFEVLEANPRRVARLRARNLPQGSA